MMSRFDALLPAVRSFLCYDLGSLSLPPSIESKRQELIDQIDILSLGPTPSVPKPVAPAPTAQRRHLNSVVRLFSTSRKRYSLPASISYPSQVPEATEPPLPPRIINSPKHDQEYEVPRSLASLASDYVATGQVRLRRHPISRCSLSPQSEMVQSNRNSTHLAEIVSHAPPEQTIDCKNDTSLTLPRKCSNTQNRRFSAFIDPSWTLAGVLYHRHKPNKWTRLSMCLLTGACRLVAYKSGHALNPSLVIFLCGATGIYAGRDSGQDYVIKIAHPTRGTTVLAADTEEQALIWIKQINQYAQGITPTETFSFLDHPALPAPTSNPVTPAHSTDQADSSKPSNKTEEDSGFSAPVSSGSEGNSADGVVRLERMRPSSVVLTDRTPSSSTLLKLPVTTTSTLGLLPQSTTQNRNSVIHETLSPASRDKSKSATIPASARSSNRRESLLSSMRRKMESLSSKRRARKSMVKSNDASNYQASTHSQISQSVDPHASGLGGCDWVQLDSAAALFSRIASDNPVISSTPEQLQSNLLLASQHGLLHDIAQTFSPSSPDAVPLDRVIVSGEACIAIPGRLPWTKRWCILHSRRLDVFPSADSPPTDPDERPLLSLTLEPGLVELGLAGDKRHKSALRLAVPSQSSASLLFDALDKVQLGAWIRGFIEALGIIGTYDSTTGQSTITGDHSLFNRSTDGTEYDLPDSTYSSITPHQNSDSTTDYMSSRLTSLSLYDEVCTSHNSGSVYTTTTTSQFRRRWSSPTPTAAAAAQQQSLSAIHDGAFQSATSFHSTSPHWLVPPPSRRLLAQPLPPLPSVGPSGAESLAGTIDSSHTSSNMTPDEADKRPTADSEPEFGTYSRPQDVVSPPHFQPRSQGSQTTSSVAPGEFRQPNRCRHSSLSSLECYQYAYQFNLQAREIQPTSSQVDRISKGVNANPLDSSPVKEEDSVTESRTSMTQGNCPSNLSLTISEDHESPYWPAQLSSAVWPEDAQQAHPPSGALPRRSVSCLNGTKPNLTTVSDCRAVATLPSRHDFPTRFQNETYKSLPVSTGSQLSSSHSSTTATSSGVALTAGSLSSLGSEATTTLPSTMAISWQPTVEEEGTGDSAGLNDPVEMEKMTNTTLRRNASTHCGTPPFRTKQKSCLKRSNTTSSTLMPGSDQTPDLTYSPTNASLILVATQLEEVQHGAKRLRSRHNALSFRLTNRMAREQKVSPVAAEASTDIPPNEVADVSRSTPSTGGKTLADETEEASESLRARLAAIEALIQQAESMELMLRTEMNKYMSSGSVKQKPTETVALNNDNKSPCTCKQNHTQRSSTDHARPRGRGGGRGGRTRRRRNNNRSARQNHGQSWMETCPRPSQPNNTTLVPPAM